MSDEVKDYLVRGIYGEKELRKEEKIRFLGEFRERVILALTQSQVRRKDLYPQVSSAARRHPDAAMLLNGEMEYEALSKYIKLAGELGIPFRKVYDNKTDTDLGLVLAAPRAADISNIFIEDAPTRAASAAPGPKRSGITAKIKALFAKRNDSDS